MASAAARDGQLTPLRRRAGTQKRPRVGRGPWTPGGLRPAVAV